METKKIVRTEESISDKTTNKKFIFDTAKISMENLDGEIIGILGIGHDITLREKKEEELKKLNELTLSLTKSQQVLLSLFDKGDSTLFKWKNGKDWPIEYVSLSIEKLFDYSRNKFITANIPFIDYIYKDDIPRVLYEVETAIKENKSYFKHEPYRIITKNKQLKWVLDYTAIQKNDQGEITHFYR